MRSRGAAGPSIRLRLLGAGPSIRLRLLGTGFTLLEILVVIVIIGVIASLAVLSIGDRALDDRLDIEARRLQELIALAAEQAVMQGAELGFVQTADGYAFLALKPEPDKPARWLPLDDASPLHPRALSEPMYLELLVEGRAVKPLAADVEPEQLKPQVMLLSSGETTEFTLALRAREYAPRYELKGDALGRFTLERKVPS
ncbi:MAG TPA: type II secretion system minor pseudopilin GspH [Verrucomicrobiae bacterium]|nr:type II secretion system minor pseudopilin GspH [Verrucomicrobiae bacterium]